ncbi:MAG: hypothetical protein NTW87_05400 [Planctomycetota bacterium]|nr:hypothetical protein [Planctomycetota bacterium]
MTDAPKKRAWLQFHLSTAVVLMFVAGGIMALNCVRAPLAACLRWLAQQRRAFRLAAH